MLLTVTTGGEEEARQVFDEPCGALLLWNHMRTNTKKMLNRQFQMPVWSRVKKQPGE
jgi:hypothetical protein